MLIISGTTVQNLVARDTCTPAICNSEAEGKRCPGQRHKDKGTFRRIAQLYLFLISALDGGECSTSRLGIFNPLKRPRHPLSKSRRMGGPQVRSGGSVEENKVLAMRGFKYRIAHPVA